MTFHIITIFPESMKSYFETSILARARKEGLIKLNFLNIRNFTKDKHRITDDRPYGGGAGMVMKAEPIIKAVESILNKNKNKKKKIFVLSAKGKQFNQKKADELLKKYNEIIIICGRYEGIDERVKKVLKAEEISIGPYILTDGEIAAGVIVSSITRLVPGVIKLESLKEESHWNKLLEKEKMGSLEYPHYTRPEIFMHKGKKYKVPKVLLSGHHKNIEEWRKKNQKS